MCSQRRKAHQIHKAKLPRHNLEREDARPNFSPNRTASPLSFSPKRFSFSADMDEASDLAERALNGEFPELLKKSPPITSNNPKKLAESSKINKKPLFLKKYKIHPKREAATGFIL